MENPLYQPSIRVLDDNETPGETFILATVPVEWEMPGVSPLSPYAPRISIPVKLDAIDSALPLEELMTKAAAEVPKILRTLADAAERQIESKAETPD